MQFRNPKFNQFGTIDCEILHPAFGQWIPTTVDPLDTKATYDAAALDSQIRAAGGIAAYAPPASAPASSITEVQKWKFEKALKASRKDGTLAASGDPRAFMDTRNAIWAYDADARDEYEARSILSRDVAIQPSVRHGAIVMRLAVVGLTLGTADSTQLATAQTEADLFLDRIFVRATSYQG